MAHHEHSQGRAQPQEKEAVFCKGRIGIIEQEAMLIVEDPLAFVERNAVLPLIGPGLPQIPREAEVTHTLQCTYMPAAPQCGLFPYGYP